MIYLIVIVLAFAFGGIITYLFLTRKKKNQATIEATILLEKIKTVCKLVCVEGDFSEILDFQDKKNIVFNLIPQNKRALLIVQAKAMVGYDLTKANIQVDSVNKRFTISNLPNPEIISIQTDIKYYDINESRFNKFNPDDYTNFDKQAKQKIKDKVTESPLLNHAKGQGLQTIELIKEITSASGWELYIPEKIAPPKQLTLGSQKLSN